MLNCGVMMLSGEEARSFSGRHPFCLRSRGRPVSVAILERLSLGRVCLGHMWACLEGRRRGSAGRLGQPRCRGGSLGGRRVVADLPSAAWERQSGRAERWWQRCHQRFRPQGRRKTLTPAACPSPHWAAKTSRPFRLIDEDGHLESRREDHIPRRRALEEHLDVQGARKKRAPQLGRWSHVRQRHRERKRGRG